MFDEEKVNVSDHEDDCQDESRTVSLSLLDLPVEVSR